MSDREEFARVWEAAASVGEVATALGITAAAARARAYRLRRAGVKLKRFSPGPARTSMAWLDTETRRCRKCGAIWPTKET